MNREQQRFQAAVAAMRGILTYGGGSGVKYHEELAKNSVGFADALLAELDRTKPEPEMPQPDADGWIPHKPGDPMPCHEETMCYRKYRSGKIGAKDKAGDYSWSEWIGGVTEIIAWKPAE